MFAERLRRLREATLLGDDVLTLDRLARRARLDMTYVWYLEQGRREHPSRAVVERLCAALACSDVERAMLLCAAGYWPWPDADDDVTELLVALALAVLDGDYRPLEATVRETVTTGVR